MKRFAPLPVVTGLFMAIALPLKARDAGDTGQTAIKPVDQIVEAWIDLQEADRAVTQVVCAWIDEHQADLTATLTAKLDSNTALQTAELIHQQDVGPAVIYVTTKQLKRLHTDSEV